LIEDYEILDALFDINSSDFYVYQLNNMIKSNSKIFNAWEPIENSHYLIDLWISNNSGDRTICLVNNGIFCYKSSNVNLSMTNFQLFQKLVLQEEHKYVENGETKMNIEKLEKFVNTFVTIFDVVRKDNNSWELGGEVLIKYKNGIFTFSFEDNYISHYDFETFKNVVRQSLEMYILNGMTPD